jgi:hypothetical protein
MSKYSDRTPEEKEAEKQAWRSRTVRTKVIKKQLGINTRVAARIEGKLK